MSDDKKVVDVVVKIKGISLFGENNPKDNFQKYYKEFLDKGLTPAEAERLTKQKLENKQ